MAINDYEIIKQIETLIIANYLCCNEFKVVKILAKSCVFTMAENRDQYFEVVKLTFFVTLVQLWKNISNVLSSSCPCLCVIGSMISNEKSRLKSICACIWPRYFTETD